jgi:hypothetical protein
MNNVDIKAAEPDRVSASYMLLMKSNCQIAFQPLSRADEILTFFGWHSSHHRNSGVRRHTRWSLAATRWGAAHLK